MEITVVSGRKKKASSIDHLSFCSGECLIQLLGQFIFFNVRGISLDVFLQTSMLL